MQADSDFPAISQGETPILELNFDTILWTGENLSLVPGDVTWTIWTERGDDPSPSSRLTGPVIVVAEGDVVTKTRHATVGMLPGNYYGVQATAKTNMRPSVILYSFILCSPVS